VTTAIDAQLLKGVVSMLLLRLLAEEESYGYQLVLRLQGCGFETLAEGTVYPALTRLESKGLLESRLVRSHRGPARKYYRPTPAGGAELERSIGAWADLVARVDRALTGHEASGEGPTREVEVSDEVDG
jgi:PadR family transcriptional regulator PadR